MGVYFFTATALPPISIGTSPDLSFADMMFLCETNLSHADLEKTHVMRTFYDLQNLRQLWAKNAMSEKLDETLDPRANLDENGLEEALLTGTGLPDYVYDFMRAYDDRDSRLKHFPALIATYFKVETARHSGFLRRYLAFERDWRLVFAGFRAKQLKRDLVAELQFEDADDDLVRQILAQKDAEHYEPPEDYRELREIFEEYHHDPLTLHQVLSQYRFEKIAEFLGTDLFSIDCILGYLAQLIEVEKWMELDKKKGLHIVNRIVKEVT